MQLAEQQYRQTRPLTKPDLSAVMHIDILLGADVKKAVTACNWLNKDRSNFTSEPPILGAVMLIACLLISI